MSRGVRSGLTLSVAAAVSTILVGLPAFPAQAAFPGANGLIVFQHEAPAGDHTQTDLFVVRPDGTGVRRLTHTPARNEFGPTWNAAGTRIAMWRTPAPFGPGSIWVMDADGSHQRRLTTGVDARDPAWNPAGTRLVFSAPVGQHSDLFTLRASDGGGRKQLTTNGQDIEPAWSADGRFVAFTRGDHITVLNLRTGHVRTLTHSTVYDHQVGWAPGSRRLVFERDFNRRFAICAIKIDGTGFKELTGGPHFDVGPAFSPDGKLIAFGSDRGNPIFHDIWVMRADGSNKHRLFDFSYANGFPDWQPT
jgi:TolB protein